MGRRRIIVEIEEDLDLLGQLKTIGAKVTDIQKKQNPPWVLPVVLLFLTATMTYVNYRIQRHYVNEDLYKNKLKEKIAEARAVATVDFFRKTKEALDTIDVAFESFCIIDTSVEDNNIITNGLIRLKALVRHQLNIDTVLQRKLTAYMEFVSEKTVQTDTFKKSVLMEAYKRSTGLYNDAKNQIDNSLQRLTQ